MRSVRSRHSHSQSALAESWWALSVPEWFAREKKWWLWKKRERNGERVRENVSFLCLDVQKNIQLVDLQDDEGNQIVEEFTSEYVFKYPPDPGTWALNWINPIENGMEGGDETLERPTLIWGPQPARQAEEALTCSKDQFTQCFLHLIHLNWAI